MKIKLIASVVLMFASSLANAEMLLDAMPRTMKAENFTLPHSTGGKLSLEELRGKFVLVNFWTTKCAPCRAELSLLEDLRNQLADEDILEVVAIHAGPDVIGVNAFACHQFQSSIRQSIFPDSRNIVDGDIAILDRSGTIDGRVQRIATKGNC